MIRQKPVLSDHTEQCCLNVIFVYALIFTDTEYQSLLKYVYAYSIISFVSLKEVLST